MLCKTDWKVTGPDCILHIINNRVYYGSGSQAWGTIVQTQQPVVLALKSLEPKKAGGERAEHASWVKCDGSEYVS